MDPDKYCRLLQGLDLEAHQSHSASFKDQEVRGVLGVNLNKMKIREWIGAHFSDLFGGGEIVKSASGDTVWYVPKKSIDEFRERYDKTHDSKFTETTLAEFIKNHESDNIQGLQDVIKGKLMTKEELYKEVKTWLKDFTYAQGPLAEMKFFITNEMVDSKNLERLLELQKTFLQARRGNPQAQLDLAKSYSSGLLRIANNHKEKAFEWYKKAAEQGNPEAQYGVAQCYQNGSGVVENKKRMFEWYEEAAKGGLDEAQYQLGVCYQFGKGVHENNEKAFDWYQRAEKQGNPDAMNALATCYRKGIGTEEDLKKAVDGYRAASIKGNTEATYNLGVCYVHGIGVEQSDSKAFSWYQLAANQGNANGMYALASFYSEGVVINKDLKKAFIMYEEAAKLGHEIAIASVVTCYENGIGVDRSPVKAEEWRKIQSGRKEV